ncbi:MAG: helix-hairpin-helix domain-containing protein [Clostridia bacterium]
MVATSPCERAVLIGAVACLFFASCVGLAARMRLSPAAWIRAEAAAAREESAPEARAEPGGVPGDAAGEAPAAPSAGALPPEAAGEAAELDEAGFPHRVDLNSATWDELLALPGIGPALAARILEYRESRGGFRSVDELLNVKGIGKSRFSRLLPLVTLEPPAAGS